MVTIFLYSRVQVGAPTGEADAVDADWEVQEVVRDPVEGLRRRRDVRRHSQGPLGGGLIVVVGVVVVVLLPPRL